MRRKMMNGEAQLILIAELAIALAGFAGIVATNQFKDTGRFSRGDAVGLALIVHCGAIDGFFAMMPMAIYALGFTEQTAFNVSSAMHCINISLYVLWIRRNMQGVQVRNRRTRAVYSSLYAIAAIVIAMNLMNAFNIVFYGEFGPYFLACILPLLMAAFMFIRLVTRPLWYSVRQHEHVGADLASSS
jgi:hypothetical protein